MSKLVDDLLNFFERREGTRISAGDVEEVMEAAAIRIEELEARVKELEAMVEKERKRFQDLEVAFCNFAQNVADRR